jgi:hypothetical protein
MVLAFSQGGGGTTELWSVDTPFKVIANYGFLPADLGVAQFIQEIELEISGITLMNCLYGVVKSDAQQYNYSTGASRQSSGDTIIPSFGYPIQIPQNRPFVLRTSPSTLPAAATTFSGSLYIGFDASGAAGSATGVIKINRWEIKRVGQ